MEECVSFRFPMQFFSGDYCTSLLGKKLIETLVKQELFTEYQERIYKGKMEKKKGFTDFTRFRIHFRELFSVIGWKVDHTVWTSQQKIAFCLLELIM